MLKSLALAMGEDGFVSYDRYLARDFGPYYTWHCDECGYDLNDDGWCEFCEEEDEDG